MMVDDGTHDAVCVVEPVTLHSRTIREHVTTEWMDAPVFVFIFFYIFTNGSSTFQRSHFILFVHSIILSDNVFFS